MRWQPHTNHGPLPIRLDYAVQETGLGPMLAELMQQNVRRHPERRHQFKRLYGRVAIEATDAAVTVTMEFMGGKLLMHNGNGRTPDLHITADSLTLLELTNAKLRLGLPDVTHPSGRTVLRKLLSGRLRIAGPAVVFKPLLLLRLTKLLNVAA